MESLFDFLFLMSTREGKSRRVLAVIIELSEKTASTSLNYDIARMQDENVNISRILKQLYAKSQFTV